MAFREDVAELEKDNSARNTYKIFFSLTFGDIDDMVIPSRNISKFIVIHDYMKNELPLYKLDLVLSKADYLKIRAKVNDFRPVIKKVSLRLLYQMTPQGKDVIATKEATAIAFRSYNDMIAVIDYVPDISREDAKNFESLPVNDESNTVKLSMALFNDCELNAFSKGVCDGVVVGDTNALLHEIIRNTVHDDLKYMFKRSDNKTSYEQAVIPTVGFSDGLAYLYDMFDLYTSPASYYMRDKELYIFPFTGKYNDSHKDKIKNKKFYIEAVDSTAIVGTAVKTDTDEVFHILVDKNQINRNKIYNILKVKEVYVAKEGLKDSGLQFDYIHDIKTYNSIMDTGVINTDQHVKVINLNLDGCSPSLDAFPFTYVKCISNNFEGEYRVGSFIEAFTGNGFEKKIGIFATE